MRIHDDRAYLVKDRSREYVVLGMFVEALGCRSNIVSEFTGDNRTYRIVDGHLPDNQLRLSGHNLIAVMRANRYPVAVPV